MASSHDAAPPLTEEDRREWFRSVAWSDFISFAHAEEGMREAFSADTGKAVTAETMADFVLWVTVNHWGMDEAPKLYREAHANV